MSCIHYNVAQSAFCAYCVLNCPLPLSAKTTSVYAIYSLYRRDQKSYTNFKIQLRIVNVQEYVKLISFNGLIHSLFHAISVLKFGHHVSQGEHPVDILLLSLCVPAVDCCDNISDLCLLIFNS